MDIFDTPTRSQLKAPQETLGTPEATQGRPGSRKSLPASNNAPTTPTEEKPEGHGGGVPPITVADRRHEENLPGVKPTGPKTYDPANLPLGSVPFGRVKTDAPIWNAEQTKQLLAKAEARRGIKATDFSETGCEACGQSVRIGGVWSRDEHGNVYCPSCTAEAAAAGCLEVSQ